MAASAEMESFFASLSPVSFRLHVGWFGSEVLILIPDPAEPLIHLTQSILDQWPEYPYYGGLYETVEPHLSLGFGTAELLEPIAAAVEAYVPISVTIAAVTLLVGPHESDHRPVLPPGELTGERRLHEPSAVREYPLLTLPELSNQAGLAREGFPNGAIA